MRQSFTAIGRESSESRAEKLKKEKKRKKSSAAKRKGLNQLRQACRKNSETNSNTRALPTVGQTCKLYFSGRANTLGDR